MWDLLNHSSFSLYRVLSSALDAHLYFYIWSNGANIISLIRRRPIRISYGVKMYIALTYAIYSINYLYSTNFDDVSDFCFLKVTWFNTHDDFYLSFTVFAYIVSEGEKSQRGYSEHEHIGAIQHNLMFSKMIFQLSIQINFVRRMEQGKQLERIRSRKVFRQNATGSFETKCVINELSF